jgi:hypothetical protein
MGYTHYFAYDPEAEPFITAWPRMLRDAQLIAAYASGELGVRLANGFGDGSPQLDSRRIWLNGCAEGDLRHESFLIEGTGYENQRGGRGLHAARWVRGFCKTARKPYDIAVTSILLRFRHLAPEAFVIASDGGWEDDWCLASNAPGRARPAPAEVVRHLFAQAETPAQSRLAPSGLPVSRGPGLRCL